MQAPPDKRPDSSAEPSTTFDERLWPVLAALVLLAALGGAAIWQVADFDDPRWWANGWTFLGSLAGVTLLLLLALSFVGRARRAIQLAAILSLLVHIGLFLSLAEYRLHALRDDRLADRELPPQVEEFHAPDYHLRAPEDPAEAFEKPVETELPDEKPQELDRLEQPQEPQPADESQPTPVPGETPDVEANVLPLQKLEQAPPRLAPTPAELSRADAPEVDPMEPAPVPLPEQQPSAELDAPTPASDQAERQVSEAERPLPRQEPLAPMNVETTTDAQVPQRAGETAVAAPEPALPSALASRSAEAAQLRAPQIADAPRAQSGIDRPLEDPQPVVPAPIREGTGTRLPRELGTLEGEQTRVAVRPAAPNATAALVPRQDAARSTPGSADALPALEPGSATTQLRKSATAAVPAPAARVPALEGMTVDAPQGTGEPARPAAAVPALEPSRQSTAARVPVRAPAPLDVGGLARNATPDLSTPARRALEENPLVPPGTARLLTRKSGGPLAIDGRSRDPAEAFAHRGEKRDRAAGPSGEMAQKTEAAIELGLVFLAEHQRDDGSWSLRFAADSQVPDPPSMFRAETAATGLALLAFLGAGYDHYGGGYADVVQKALDYLVSHQKASGDLYQPEDAESNRSAWLYSHGIATIALCEAYGMTGDRDLQEAAQKAIDFIVAAQDPRFGAWRYEPRNGSDTSVAGWQLMALKSGELAGLRVPPQTYENVRRWLDRAQVAGSQYAYNPGAADTPQQRHGRLPSPSMTAVALLMRLYTGLNRQDVHMVEGAEYLLGRLPAVGTSRDPARDTYYWYYATQVMFHMRGKYWREWNGRLHPLLVDTQIQTGQLAGSWDPREPVPDRWGPHAGRIYVTTLNLLSLEVYYRHLPLYESTAQ